MPEKKNLMILELKERAQPATKIQNSDSIVPEKYEKLAIKYSIDKPILPNFINLSNCFLQYCLQYCVMKHIAFVYKTLSKIAG